MTMKHAITFLLVSASVRATFCFQRMEWKRVASRDGIKVYTKKRYPILEDQGYERECVLDAVMVTQVINTADGCGSS